MQESILRFFQSIQNPTLDKLFTYLTLLGEQYFIILVVTFIFWNYSKKEGFILIFIFAISSMVNLVAKAVFHTQRPFHKLKDLNAQRVHTAKGHSFPSGHTQGATTLFLGVAKVLNKRTIMAFAVFISILIGVSRMYLGVHWPIDVIGGFVLAFIVVFFLYGYLIRVYEKPKKFYRLLVLVLIIFHLSMLAVWVLDKYYWKASVEMDSFYSLVGISTGAILAFIIEEKRFPFSVRASTPIRYLRYLIGLAGVIGIKEGLSLVLPENMFGIMLIYFLIGAWITGIFPILGLSVRLFLNEQKRN